MKTTTYKINELLENTTFSLIETGESKSSNYWFLWDNSNGDFPKNGINENDAIKLRVSNHDAICGRSLTKYEVVYDFYIKTGYQVTLNLDCWIEGLEKEEIMIELNETFNFDFSKIEIEEINGCQITFNIQEQEIFEEICAIILIKKLL